MSKDQLRQPAGTPIGGQYAPDPNASASAPVELGEQVYGLPAGVQATPQQVAQFARTQELMSSPQTGKAVGLGDSMKVSDAGMSVNIVSDAEGRLIHRCQVTWWPGEGEGYSAHTEAISAIDPDGKISKVAYKIDNHAVQLTRASIGSPDSAEGDTAMLVLARRMCIARFVGERVINARLNQPQREGVEIMQKRNIARTNPTNPDETSLLCWMGDVDERLKTATITFTGYLGASKALVSRTGQIISVTTRTDAGDFSFKAGDTHNLEQWARKIESHYKFFVDEVGTDYKAPNTADRTPSQVGWVGDLEKRLSPIMRDVFKVADRS